MTCEKAEDLLSAYLDDMLAPQLKDEVAAHVEGCASCQQILADYRRFDASIVQYGRMEPSPALRDRIFSSPEYDAIVRHAAEAAEAEEREADRARFGEAAARRTFAPPGWARGAVAAAVAVLVLGSALLIKQGLLYSGTPSARISTPINGVKGTQPLAAGARVVFERDGALWSIRSSGAGQAEQLTPEGVAVGAWSVSPKGQYVAYVDVATGRIHIIRSDDQNDMATSSVSVTGAGAFLVWSLDESGPQSGDTLDNLSIAYRAATPGAGTTLRIMAANGSNDLAVNGATAVVGAPAWSGNGSFLAYVQAGPSGQTLWVDNVSAGGITHQISAIDPSGAQAQITASGLRWLANPNVSPRITWATSDGVTITGMYVANALSGGATSRIASGTTFSATDVAWSPDGMSAALVSSTGAVELWSASGGLRSVSAVTNASGTPAWSADGKRMAVAAGNGVTVVQVASGAATLLAAPVGVMRVALAPDGKGVAIVTPSGVTVYGGDGALASTSAGPVADGSVAWTVAG